MKTLNLFVTYILFILAGGYTTEQVERFNAETDNLPSK